MKAQAVGSEHWAALEGQAVNGVFPLLRYLGSTERSGVFLIDPAKEGSCELAIKLIPATAALVQSHLPHWRAAIQLSHPHLMRVYQAGQCEVRGTRYLYALMEYSDQNLAELLEHRALTEDETREMLIPALSALEFLHEKNLVQGSLKPSNVLVVGDQLKLACDTVRPAGDVKDNIRVISAYDPPEAAQGARSAAADIWALGVTTCEALTRRQPSGLHGAGEIMLPQELPPAFEKLVASCLKRNPQERATVAQLQASVRGEEAKPPPAPVQTAEEPVPAPSKRQVLPLVVAAVLIVAALGWAGFRVLVRAPAPAVVEVEGDPVAQAPAPLDARMGAAVTADSTTHQESAAPLTSATPQTPASRLASARPEASASRLASATPDVSASPVASTIPAEPDTDAAPLVIHEEIPDVPRSARETIRGTVRVSVRVIVEDDGTVLAALADDPGPSRYFERLAIEAAKNWTFAPADVAPAPRVMQVRFAFTREGTTARAVALR